MEDIIMKGIHTYLGLALLLSVAVVPNAFSTEENIDSAKALVAKAAACAEQASSTAAKLVEGTIAAPTRYERFSSLVGDARSWGAKFGTGLYTKATSHATSLKDGFNGYAQKTQSGLTSVKDAVTQYPYKTVANDTLGSMRDQALAHKPLLIGAGLATAYELGALNLVAKPVVYAGRGIKAGAQKAYAAAKNHKKVTGGLSAAVIAGAAGAGYYFKDALAQAAQSGLAHVQPMVATVLENKSDIGKTAGVALVGVAAIEGARGLYNIVKQYTTRNAVLVSLKSLMREDLDALNEKTATTSKFFNAATHYLNQKKLFSEKELKQIDGFKRKYNEAFNKVLYLENGKAKANALQDIKNISTAFLMAFGL